MCHLKYVMAVVVAVALLATPAVAVLFGPIAESVAVLRVEEPEKTWAKELRLKEPPASWDIDALANEMPYRWAAGTTRILLWEVIHEAETVWEKCLVLKQYARPSDRGETCALGSLIRYPKGEKGKWTIDKMHIAPDPDFKNDWGWRWGYACYKALPTDKEIGAFLAKWMWENAVKPYKALSLDKSDKFVWVQYNPRLTDGGVNRVAWKKVFGREPPAKLFPEDSFPELVVTRKPAKK